MSEAEVRKPLRILPVACGLGAPPWAAAGCATGAEALLSAGMAQVAKSQGRTVRLSPPLRPPRLPRQEALAHLCRELADRVSAALEAGELPLVLGGDHAIAAGTWRGAARPTAGPFGLLWIDAHMDAHRPEDSPSGNWHGMPLASLLGSGAVDFTAIPGPSPDPAHICIVGVRSYESAELAYLCGRHVRIFGMSEIGRKGLPQVMHEALNRVRQGTRAWGLSLDLDAVDPSDSPGVSTPAAHGVTGAELVAALGGLARSPELAALELVEYNPERDENQRSALLALSLAASILR
ncbi:MAG: arginase [Rhodocyclaceae bacterium]|nr:arginase [Rhodocyclaceae bacterium]